MRCDAMNSNVTIKEAYDKINLPSARKDKIFSEILKKREEESNIGFFRINSKVAGIILGLLITGLCVTAGYAASRWLKGSEVAGKLGHQSAEEMFKENEKKVTKNPETYVFGNLTFAYIGMVHGEAAKKYSNKAGADKTYAVVAVTGEGDGLTLEETDYIVSPLVEGFDPSEVNLFSLGGISIRNIIDGTCYLLFEYDDLSEYAGHRIYLAISESADYSKSYLFDKETGHISRNPEFSGLNLLFDVDIDLEAVTKPDNSETMEKSTEDTSASISPLAPVITGTYKFPERLEIYGSTGNPVFDEVITISMVRLPESLVESFVEMGTCIMDESYASDEDGYIVPTFECKYLSAGKERQPVSALENRPYDMTPYIIEDGQMLGSLYRTYSDGVVNFKFITYTEEQAQQILDALE